VPKINITAAIRCVRLEIGSCKPKKGIIDSLSKFMNYIDFNLLIYIDTLE
jgi:hypothetical protein